MSESIVDPGRLMALLQSLTLGDLDALRGKLVEARRGCLSLGEPDLADRIAEASAALGAGDLRTYRKRIETVVSRLGHLR